jgi:hypothetical protein
VSNGCEGFCDLLILPELATIKKNANNFSNDTFNLLINMRATKKCGCIIDNVARDKCFNIYIIK